MGQAVIGYEYFTLDVFTDQRFGGNPLAVVLDSDELNSKQMQLMAREFNLSETVFVMKPQNHQNTASVRIFTPARELPFAGHPTIGAAMLLADLGSDMSKPLNRTIKLEEQVGLVGVEISRQVGEALYGELRAAEIPVKIDNVPGNSAIAGALDIKSGDIGYGLHKACIYDAGNAPLFVPLASRETLSRIRVVSEKWGELGEAGNFGIYAYCRGPADSNQLNARFFAPEVGILEDPATGSAAVAFAGALNKALVLEDGVHKWQILQGYDMDRPSQIDLTAEIISGKLSSVLVGGNSVRIARGVITI